MQARLIVHSGPKTGTEIRLNRFPFKVGRRRSCNLCITSRSVSREHCVFETTGGYLTIRDLGSTNKSYVNNVPINHSKILEPGDLVEIGPVVFRVEYNPPNLEDDDFFVFDNESDSIHDFVLDTEQNAQRQHSPELITRADPMQLTPEAAEFLSELSDDSTVYEVESLHHFDDDDSSDDTQPKRTR